MQKNLKIGQGIQYWRTRQKDEVDFIIVQDRMPVAVEVKSKLKGLDIPQGVRRFIQQYPNCHKVVILNNDIFKKVSFDKREILFAPHYYAHLIPGLF